MFKGLANLGQLGSILKQVQQMGTKLQEVSEQLKRQRASGSSGGGLVTVEVNGLGEVLSCRIDRSLIEAADQQFIEDLLPGAINQALSKAKELHAQAIQSMAQGIDLPGLADLIAQAKSDDSAAPKPS